MANDWIFHRIAYWQVVHCALWSVSNSFKWNIRWLAKHINTPPGRHPLARHPPTHCILGYTHTPCPVHTGIHPTGSYCCGRYTSYWNACLYLVINKFSHIIAIDSSIVYFMVFGQWLNIPQNCLLTSSPLCTLVSKWNIRWLAKHIKYWLIHWY